MQEIETFTKYGTSGIALALIGLITLLVKISREDRKDFKEVITNHIDHSTEIQRQQTGVMERLASVIEGLDRRLNGK